MRKRTLQIDDQIEWYCQFAGQICGQTIFPETSLLNDSLPRIRLETQHLPGHPATIQ